MNQPAKGSMRDHMPQTAKWVDARRAEWGADHVNGCIRRAIAGEPGHFYAIEGGQVLGTPFPIEHAIAEWQSIAIAAGVPFAAFMREPSKRGADGAH